MYVNLCISNPSSNDNWQIGVHKMTPSHMYSVRKEVMLHRTDLDGKNAYAQSFCKNRMGCIFFLKKEISFIIALERQDLTS